MTDEGVVPVAVTFTVRDDGGGDARRDLVIDGQDEFCWEDNVRDFFGGIPRLPYTVTYCLSPEGPYIVRDDDFCAGPMITRVEGVETLSVCALPHSWRGQRVIREVRA